MKAEASLPKGRPAVLYLRRSTDLQDQSIGSQRDYLVRYAEANGLEIVDEYVDDAVSGTSVDRRLEFQRLIRDAQGKGGFSAVLCYDVKRFSRGDVDEVGHFRYVLRQKGIEVVYASEDFKDDFTGDLLRPIRQVMARQESVDLSKVTLRGHLTSINAGHYIGGVTPYGYDYLYIDSAGNPAMKIRYMANGDRQMLRPDGELIRLVPQGERWRANRQDRILLVPSLPERVEIVRRIFRMYLEGLGIKPIASRLNAEGVKSPRCGQWGGTYYDGRWGATTIYNIITNQTYCGDTLWNRRTEGKFHRVSNGQAVARDRKLAGISRRNPKEDWVVIRDTHEPLISRKTFEQVVEIRKKKDLTKGCRNLLLGRGKTSRYLLSGLIRCTLCGNRFQGYSQKIRRGPKAPLHERPQTYLCGGYVHKGASVCKRRAIERAPFEDFVLDCVHARLLEVLDGGGMDLLRDYVREELDRAASKPLQEIQEARSELADLKAEADRLLRNLTEANREFIDERLIEIKRRRLELDSRVMALEGAEAREIDPEAAVEAAMGRLTQFREVLEAGSFAERKEFLRCFVIGIDLDPEAKRGALHMHNMVAASFSTNGWTRPKFYREAPGAPREKSRSKF